ncbi:MAG: indolepyruvate ferredoxin oxidoreductase alpha subunit [Akkermansiaceae bacterium]|jgi:indolepyruvate ferredoxin oxidoreductase alpha subunit
MSYLHEQDKIKNRWPADEAFITENKLNDAFGPNTRPWGWPTSMATAMCQFMS